MKFGEHVLREFSHKERKQRIIDAMTDENVRIGFEFEFISSEAMDDVLALVKDIEARVGDGWEVGYDSSVMSDDFVEEIENMRRDYDEWTSSKKRYDDAVEEYEQKMRDYEDAVAEYEHEKSNHENALRDYEHDLRDFENEIIDEEPEHPGDFELEEPEKPDEPYVYDYLDDPHNPPIDPDDPDQMTDELRDLGGLGYEVTSPPLPPGSARLALEAMFDLIKDNGYTNETCGLHVNISHEKISPSAIQANIASLARASEEGAVEKVMKRRDVRHPSFNVAYAKGVEQQVVKTGKLAYKSYPRFDPNAPKDALIGRYWTMVPRSNRIENRHLGGRDYERKLEFVWHRVLKLVADYKSAGTDPSFMRKKLASPRPARMTQARGVKKDKSRADAGGWKPPAPIGDDNNVPDGSISAAKKIASIINDLEASGRSWINANEKTKIESIASTINKHHGAAVAKMILNMLPKRLSWRVCEMITSLLNDLIVAQHGSEASARANPKSKSVLDALVKLEKDRR